MCGSSYNLDMIFTENAIMLNSSTTKVIFKVLILSGNALTLLGILLLILGLVNFIQLDAFAVGLSSGIRMVGMVIITGCLLSAIGYGFLDFNEE